MVKRVKKELENFLVKKSPNKITLDKEKNIIDDFQDHIKLEYEKYLIEAMKLTENFKIAKHAAFKYTMYKKKELDKENMLIDVLDNNFDHDIDELVIAFKNEAKKKNIHIDEGKEKYIRKKIIKMLKY